MRLHRALTLLPALATTLVLPLLTAGCGNSATTLDPVATAAVFTSRAGGAHLAVSIQIDAASLPSPVTMTGEGFFNYRNAEGKLSFQASGLPAGALARLSGGALQFEEIYKSSAIYVASPLLAGELPAGARWLKLDLGRLAQAAGLNLQQLAGGQSNPAQLLQFLRASGSTPVRVGSEAVRGVATTRYRATIDLAKVAGALGAGDDAQLRAALAKLIAQARTSSIPVEVWVDSRHLVRRLALAISLSGVPGQPQLDMTMELFGFGPTPVLAPPPAGEVFDATQAVLGRLPSAKG